jgi:hypothetical protein
LYGSKEHPKSLLFVYMLPEDVSAEYSGVLYSPQVVLLELHSRFAVDNYKTTSRMNTGRMSRPGPEPKPGRARPPPGLGARASRNRSPSPPGLGPSPGFQAEPGPAKH